MDDFGYLIAIFGVIALGSIITFVIRSQDVSLHKKFLALGDMRGRRYDEIVAAVGQPNARSTIGNGRILCQWMAPGFSVGLIFTDDICDGISHEYAA